MDSTYGSTSEQLEFVIDSSQIDVRDYNQEYIDEHRSDSDYNYSLDPDKEDSILGRWLMKFLEWLDFESDADPTPTSYSWLGTVWKIIKILAIITAVGLLVLFIYKSDFNWIFKKKKANSEAIDIEVVDETSSLDNLNKYIEAAEGQGQYRLAIRLKFLRMLRILNDRDLIKAQTGKTNHAYLTELKNNKDISLIKEATKIYEYVWYGLFDIADIEEYRTLASSFDFIDQLQNSKR